MNRLRSYSEAIFAQNKACKLVAREAKNCAECHTHMKTLCKTMPGPCQSMTTVCIVWLRHFYESGYDLCQERPEQLWGKLKGLRLECLELLNDTNETLPTEKAV